MDKIKKYIYIGIAAIILILSFSTIHSCNKSSKYKNLYYKELENVEAYRHTNSGLNDDIRVFKMTIDDLNNSNDSLDKKLVEVMKNLKISEDKVKSLQYNTKYITKVDTINIKDTIFIENTNIDTLVGDKWYSMHLQLQYPATVITTPTFNSEQYVYIYNKKEYVGGKSKCFFINWFKKKHIVTEVKIEEKNPYIRTTEQKFIEVVK